MKLKQHLRLNIKDANDRVQIIAQALEQKYGIHVHLDKNIQSGYGENHNGVSGNFNIKVGTSMRLKNGLLNQYVNEIDFLKTICSLYHEEQHIIQSCKKYYDINPTDDDITMATRNLAGERNYRYYMESNRYHNDLSEIEAEAVAISNTYEYIRTQFPKVDADEMICNLINDKAKLTYFIKGHYESFDEILDAFSEHYEDAKQAKVSGYIAYALRPSQDMNPAQDECIKYLQACVRENQDEMELMTKFNSASKQTERDLMVASITCHLHPEIEYERIYPCLQYVDLSPENIFDRSIPSPNQEFVEKIDKGDIDKRVCMATDINKRIVESEYREHMKSLVSTVDVNLDSTQQIQTHSKTDSYEP